MRARVRTYVLFSDNESVTHAWRDDINALLARTNRRQASRKRGGLIVECLLMLLLLPAVVVVAGGGGCRRNEIGLV